MTHYYVNKNSQANGDHEVHKSACTWLPHEHNRQYLGDHPSCRSAVVAARVFYPQSNGCYYCSTECHTG